MTNKQRLYELIEDKRSAYTKLSDDIWSYAETRFEEKLSAQALCQALEAEGFCVEKNVGGVPYAFAGTFGTTGPVIAFLGEYDALSGLSQQAGSAERVPVKPGANGHGCGHHLLGVGALASAVALKKYCVETGTQAVIKYFGCPGEEGGSGKAFMAKAGLFKGVDAAITWHAGSTNSVFSGSSLANIQVYFKFIGKASHAAASPHLGRSALDGVELLNVGVNYMREHVVSEARVHYAVTNSGGKSPNVVQPEAEVLYLIRAPKNSQVQEIYAWVCDIARGAALMTQTQLTIEVDKACSNLIPNETLEQLMQANLEALPAPMPTTADEQLAISIRATLNQAELVKELKSLTETYGEREGRRLAQEFEGKALYTGVLPHKNSEKAMMGSTDVSDVSWNVPTVQCWTSCYALGTPGHSWQLVAQGKSAWAHQGMLHAAKAMAGTALDVILNPNTIIEAKQELRERVGPEGYICPIPDGVNPKPVK